MDSSMFVYISYKFYLMKFRLFVYCFSLNKTTLQKSSTFIKHDDQHRKKSPIYVVDVNVTNDNGWFVDDNFSGWYITYESIADIVNDLMIIITEK